MGIGKIKYDAGKHYKCQKCNGMFDNETHEFVGNNAGPFVIRRVCPSCFVDANIGDSKDVDGLVKNVVEEYKMPRDRAVQVVEKMLRLRV